MRIPIALLSACLSLASAFGDAPTVQKDIPYLGAGRAEKADLYAPAGNHPALLPTVLLIHGGGWAIGDKALTRERNICKDLASAGYAVFSINYQLNHYQGISRAGTPAVPKCQNRHGPRIFTTANRPSASCEKMPGNTASILPASR
jgi:hypothetical protein